jgi:hypothetical protein
VNYLRWLLKRMRRAPRRRGRPPPLVAEGDRLDIVEWGRAGWPLQRIQKRSGHGYRTVTKILDQAGVARRGRGRPRGRHR